MGPIRNPHSFRQKIGPVGVCPGDIALDVRSHRVQQFDNLIFETVSNPYPFARLPDVDMHKAASESQTRGGHHR